MKTGFLDLPSPRKESAFALSCYDLGDWEEGFDWLSDPREVRENIDTFLAQLLPDSLWAQLSGDEGRREQAQDLFLTGEMSNYFLAWYLEDRFDRVQSRTESNNSTSEFDVILLEDDVPTVGIEMKRVANSGQLTNYLRDFPEKCDQRQDTQYKFLIVYYPVSQPVARRAQSLVRGYGPLAPMTDDFYQPENVFMANIPAPYPREDNETRPLRETRNFLREKTTVDT